MALIDDFEELRISFDNIATRLTALLASNQTQITDLQAQVAALLAQLASGLTLEQAIPIKSGLQTVEARLRALLGS